jgi:hypothetical protein
MHAVGGPLTCLYHGTDLQARIVTLLRTIDDLEAHVVLLEQSEEDFSLDLNETYENLEAEKVRRSEDRTRVARTLEVKHDELQSERAQRAQLAQKATVEKITLRQKMTAEMKTKEEHFQNIKCDYENQVHIRSHLCTSS